MQKPIIAPYIQSIGISQILKATVSTVAITNIFTLSLIFHIPASTEKLNASKLLNTIKIALRDRSVPLNKNFVPNIISANSCANTNKSTAKLKLNTEK